MNFEKLKIDIIKKLQDELPKHLYYHSIDHIQDVYDMSIMYAKLEGVNNKDQILLATAALLHDIGFIRQISKHEEIGCEISRQILPNYNYSESEIEQICGMIMATRIPQSPNNLLEEIICDADLDYLGREDFWEIGNKLFQELKYLNTINDEKEWDKLQIKFLENHHYYTKHAKSLRSDLKEIHLTKLKDKLTEN